jgi:hypothetical protein
MCMREKGPHQIPFHASSSSPFNYCIHDAPKEKRALLYDTAGSRYDVMMTNLAKLYNMIMRGVRIFPLVGIGICFVWLHKLLY